MQDLFFDQDVDRARSSGGIVDLPSGRQVRLPKTFGFCGGVANALKLLQQTIAEAGERTVWLLGEIIHNDTVNQAFQRQGVRIIPEDKLESVTSLASPDDVIVIPAFGIPDTLQRKLESFISSNGVLLDTTCDYVRRIWDFVEQKASAGYTVVIHGKANHPETRATLSRSLRPGNSVVIIPDEAHAQVFAGVIGGSPLSTYPASLIHQSHNLSLNKLAMVNQTTMLYSETCNIEAILQEHASKMSGGDMICCNTVCRATQMRQDAAAELCETGCDLYLVVGGFGSSNTNQLYRLAATHAPTYFIRDAATIAPDFIQHYQPEKNTDVICKTDWLKGVQTIGILAGASCPPTVIGDLIRKLREL